MSQDPCVQRVTASQTQNVEVLVQQIIMNEQSEGRMADLLRCEMQYREQAMTQHELFARAEGAASYNEGQLDQARRQRAQDEVVLSHVLESEYLACSEAYQQYMRAEWNAQGLSHVQGMAEELSRRLQSSEAGANFRINNLEQYAEQRYSEECRNSQRRLCEAEAVWASREQHLRSSEETLTQELSRMRSVWPTLMASEQCLYDENRALRTEVQSEGRACRELRDEIRSRGVSADHAATHDRSQLLQAMNEARIAEERVRDSKLRIRAQHQEVLDSRVALATESAIAQSIRSEIAGFRSAADNWRIEEWAESKVARDFRTKWESSAASTAAELREMSRHHMSSHHVMEGMESEVRAAAETRSRLMAEVRSARDMLDQQATESRMLAIKTRNLEGLAGTVEAVVKEHHTLETNEQRTSRLLIHTQGELREALRAVDEANRIRARDTDRDPLTLVGPGKVILTVEEHEKLRAQSAYLPDLVARVETSETNSNPPESGPLRPMSGRMTVMSH